MAEAKRRGLAKAKADANAAGAEETPTPGSEARRAPAESADAQARAAESERRLGRYLAVGLPSAAVAVALGTGAAAGIGPAILVLAAGALLGTISFFWASLRTLSGDAPLAEGFGTLAVRTSQRTDAAVEEKRTVLRALKDIELEHEVGKIDDADFAELVERYRAHAKDLMRELDVDVEPLRAQAEQAALAFLAKRGLSRGEGAEPLAASPEVVPRAAQSPAEGAGPGAGPEGGRRPCPACNASNEPDAVFCNGCGARMRQDACRGCGTTNEVDAAFCKKCGKRLASPEKTDALS